MLLDDDYYYFCTPNPTAMQKNRLMTAGSSVRVGCDCRCGSSCCVIAITSYCCCCCSSCSCSSCGQPQLQKNQNQTSSYIKCSRVQLPVEAASGRVVISSNDENDTAVAQASRRITMTSATFSPNKSCATTRTPMMATWIGIKHLPRTGSPESPGLFTK